METEIAVQMYTLRRMSATQSGLADCLSKVAAIGYPAVKFSAVAAMEGDEPAVTSKLARRMLDDNGLRCIATHRTWDKLTQDLDREIEFHLTLGCDYLAISSLPNQFRSEGADGYRRWLQYLRPIVSRLKDAGIRFGYHNHAFEFERFGNDRSTFFEIITSESAEDLYILFDVYWAQHAGFNSVHLLETIAGRVPVIHLKDKEVGDGEPTFAPIGEGNLDWPAIFPALRAAGAQWWAVELDECRRDPFDCLKSSFEFISSHIHSE